MCVGFLGAESYNFSGFANPALVSKARIGSVFRNKNFCKLWRRVIYRWTAAHSGSDGFMEWNTPPYPPLKELAYPGRWFSLVGSCVTPW